MKEISRDIRELQKFQGFCRYAMTCIRCHDGQPGYVCELKTESKEINNNCIVDNNEGCPLGITQDTLGLHLQHEKQT